MRPVPPERSWVRDALAGHLHGTVAAGAEVPGRGERGRPAMVWQCNCSTCQINRSRGGLRPGAARQHPDDPSWVGLYWVARPGASLSAAPTPEEEP